ncbi:hypothetical protein QOT17_013978 [Balamuthia mandrillaris]
MLPAIADSCPTEVLKNFKYLFHEWTEVQWILYAAPELRQFKGIRLRLHALLFRHLHFCRQLFKDQVSPSKKKQIVNTDSLTIFATLRADDLNMKDLKRVLIDVTTHFRVDLRDLVKRTFACNWSKLKANQLQELYRSLQSERAIDLSNEE